MAHLPFLRCALLGAALLLAGAATRAQALDSVFADAPRETLDLAGTPDFKLFDQAFYQNQVFLLGESHGVARVQQVDFELLRHLNQRAGVRRYLAEVDCAKAYYLNEYLRTGDEATLGRVFASWVRQQEQWGNADFMEKVRRIRGLNQTLPAARRIRFVGIDGVQDFGLLADYLAALRASGRPLPPGPAAGLDSLAVVLKNNPGPAADLALRTQRALRQAEPAARRALGGAYDEVQHVLSNLGYAPTLPNREAQLFANYQASLPLWHLTNEKLYGLWGLGHVLQSPALGGYVALAARIRQSALPGHDKIVSIICTYAGCRMMSPHRHARRVGAAARPGPVLPSQPRRAAPHRGRVKGGALLQRPSRREAAPRRHPHQQRRPNARLPPLARRVGLKQAYRAAARPPGCCGPGGGQPFSGQLISLLPRSGLAS